MEQIVTKEEMSEYAAELAGRLAAGDVVGLSGDLGAGKTTLAQQLLAALGAEGPFPSPTFTLVNTYSLPTAVHGVDRVHHVDLYRLENHEALDSIAWEDLVHDAAALVLVEWPERAEGQMPEQAKYVRIEEVSEEARRIIYEE